MWLVLIVDSVSAVKSLLAGVKAVAVVVFSCRISELSREVQKLGGSWFGVNSSGPIQRRL